MTKYLKKSNILSSECLKNDFEWKHGKSWILDPDSFPIIPYSAVNQSDRVFQASISQEMLK